jgi:hypothetical protein
VRAPTDMDLLRTWEHGLDRSPIERGLLLLAGLAGESDPGALPVGERDDRLLSVREAVFGAAFEAVVDCPRCGERLEIAFTAADVRARPAEAPVLSVEVAGTAIPFRLPTSNDVLAALREADPAAALVARCADGPVGPEAVRLVADAMAAADPRAEVLVGLTCEACAHAWEAPLDVGQFLWRDVDEHVRRLVADVDALARRYGWSEAEVLALSPRRRRVYLELGEA